MVEPIDTTTAVETPGRAHHARLESTDWSSTAHAGFFGIMAFVLVFHSFPL
jgi:hypothetical protein